MCPAGGGGTGGGALLADQHQAHHNAAGSSSNLQQQCIVTITLPGSFGSSSSRSSSKGGSVHHVDDTECPDSSSNDLDATTDLSGSTGRASSVVILSNVVHEMGHALHFLLSSSVAGAGVEDCGCWAHPELKEVAAHLTERMTRDPRCLQVRGGGVGGQWGVCGSGLLGTVPGGRDLQVCCC